MDVQRNSSRIIVNKLKEVFNLKLDKDVANFLGITANNLTNSLFHDSININHIIKKCSTINLNWLFYSKEDEPYKDTFKPVQVFSDDKSKDKIINILEENIELLKVRFSGNKRTETIYPKYEVITTHTGRHTFVVNAIRLGIPLEVIMRFTGHKNYDSIKPYLKIVDEVKSEEMKKFNLVPDFKKGY